MWVRWKGAGGPKEVMDSSGRTYVLDVLYEPEGSWGKAAVAVNGEGEKEQPNETQWARYLDSLNRSRADKALPGARAVQEEVWGFTPKRSKRVVRRAIEISPSGRRWARSFLTT